MNYYEQRIQLLDKTTLNKEVFSDGRNRKTSNDEYWKQLKVGDKVFPTVWFLRNVSELDKINEIAKNGLTIVEKSYINDPEGEWKLGGWHNKQFNCLWFKEVSRPLSFKFQISQQIWKIIHK